MLLHRVTVREKYRGRVGRPQDWAEEEAQEGRRRTAPQPNVQWAYVPTSAQGGWAVIRWSSQSLAVDCSGRGIVWVRLVSAAGAVPGGVTAGAANPLFKGVWAVPFHIQPDLLQSALFYTPGSSSFGVPVTSFLHRAVAGLWALLWVPATRKCEFLSLRNWLSAEGG